MAVPYAEVIGDPIAHSKSPLIHKFWLEKLGIEGDYRSTLVRAAELPAFLVMRKSDPEWRGCNVTMPHKQNILNLLDAVDRDIGSVNCVLPQAGRLFGIDTDGDGARAATAAWAFEPAGAKLCLIGAGGAARAFIASLDVTWSFDFRVLVRDVRKGARLLKSLGVRGEVFELDQAARAIEGCAAIVNATPLGMVGFPSMPEVILDSLCGVAQNGYALDMVTTPNATPFICRAREMGLVVSDGLTMLVGQARSAFRHFFGAQPTIACEAELRTLLLQ